MKKYFFLVVLSFACSGISGQIITTIAGNGTGSSSGAGDGTPATSVAFDPFGVAVDSTGNVFIADQYARVRKVDVNGIISTYAGSGGTGFGGDGGPATAAEFSQPLGVCIDNHGNLYIACIGQPMVRMVNAADTIFTFAGQLGSGGYSGDGGPATMARLANPIAVATDDAGNIYIADYGENRVRKVAPSGIISTFAGCDTTLMIHDGFPATTAYVNAPEDVAVDKAGNVYIADVFNQRIRKVNTAGIITTVAGNGIGTGGVGTYSGDGGPATAAGLFSPTGVAVDAMGNIYIADNLNQRIRKVNTAGVISTIVGTGTPAFSGDGGPATAAELFHPSQIRLDCGGNLYISDGGNKRVRKVTYNHAPYFSGGHIQNLAACDTGAVAINDLLAAFDIDTMQTATWKIALLPKHGTATVSWSATTTGSTLTPAGLTYLAAPGYAGMDTFRVALADCGHLVDTTTIYVKVDTGCTTKVASFPASAEPQVRIYPNPAGSSLIVEGANGGEVKIWNVLGQEVFTAAANSNKVDLNISRLTPGVYVARISRSNGMVENVRWVKN